MAVYGSSTYGVGIYGGAVGVDPGSLRIHESTAAPDATQTTQAVAASFTTEVHGT